MKVFQIAAILVGILGLMSGASLADENETPNLLFSTESGLGIQFSGEVEMEFVNVEGPGGFRNQDLTFQKVVTRSPHMRIDKAILETKIYYSEDFTYKIEFRMGDDGTRVDKHYARMNAPSLNTVFELGKNRPFVALDRMTEGYSLIGTAFWKGREYHLTSLTEQDLTEDIKLVYGLSAAMKRPLGSDDAAEDKSFKMLVYDDYGTFNGQTIEYGGRLGVEAGPVTAMGWYFTGELIDDRDWKLQLSQNFQAYDDLGDETDVTHYWYGGRVALDHENFHAMGEYIQAQDGLLPRWGYSAEIGYTFPQFSEWLPVNSIQPLIRYDILEVDDHPEQLGNPMTWDREMTTIAILTHVTDNVHLKAEYYLINEETGGEGLEDHVDDDQFVFQINLQF